MRSYLCLEGAVARGPLQLRFGTHGHTCIKAFCANKILPTTKSATNQFVASQKRTRARLCLLAAIVPHAVKPACAV
eukprot:3581582-Pleurochrysis_carterae.AAC.4